MCTQAPTELESRIVRALPEGGRVQAFEIFQGLGDDGTCLEHFCRAVRSLLEQKRLRSAEEAGAVAASDVLDLLLQAFGSLRTVAPGLVYDPGLLLGRGNSAAVYRGEDRRSGRPLAVKVLEIRGAPSAELRSWYLERFRQEPCLMARLGHPYVVEVVAWGETDDGPWYAMELIEGGTLLQRIRKERRLAPEDVRACFRAVASALAAAAKLGVQHRDVKPGNIFSAGWKLADFGIAKVRLASDVPAGPGKSITSSGARIGTPPYVAPERAAYGAGDLRSDQYSLGATMYQAATGRLLFDLAPDDARGWAEHHLHAVPVPVGERVPGFPAELGDILMRCLAKAPGERYPTFDALVAALDT